MKYRITFRIFDHQTGRPNDCGPDTGDIEGSELPFVPSLGDSVTLTFDQANSVYIVRSRHFNYSPNYMGVYVVVEKANDEETAARLNG